jgi:organic hydroperoxide reductase OsmC/OhrA
MGTTKQHNYKVCLQWTGNSGAGTMDYKSYSRDHRINVDGKLELMASSDKAFRGNPKLYTPEDMLVASVSSCHMLWYLHLCAVNGVAVVGYKDNATGIMNENPDGSGKFEEITLHPEIVVTGIDMVEKATALHLDANKMCFIASSLNFPVKHVPTIKVEAT